MRKRSCLLCLLFSVGLALTTAWAGPIPDTDTIPASLEPWKPWVLNGEEERFCPTFYNDGEAYQCVWPSVLDLEIGRNGGRFHQKWRIFAEGWVPLPGGRKQWPLDVKIDGNNATVVGKNGIPSVHMVPGVHAVNGIFSWSQAPEKIQIPPQSGLVSLLLNDEKVIFPLLDTRGRLWLHKQKRDSAGEARVTVKVFRLLDDNIPMKVTTLLKIHVSGPAREIKLKGALLEKFIPLYIRSAIPARLGAEGDLMVQARPGRWEVRVQARSEAPVHSISPAELPYGQEIWAFQSRNHLRMVKVEGVPSIDPTQTDVPGEWKGFPAFIVQSGDTMQLKEIRRGDPDPAPDQLHINRTWWLDFDGGGFTIQDKITGTMSSQWYLAMNPPGILGRVTVGGKDQLITSQGKDGKPGVELRKGKLDLVSESRIAAASSEYPAVGWDHDFKSVSGKLNLPSGWRLLYAGGVDGMPGTWFARWTLLDLFLVLIISLSIFKLWTWRWGVLALVALALMYHEPGAPRVVWLHILAATALLRVLPDGWMRKLVNIWFLVSLVTLLVLAIPFMVQQARWGIYPQLEPHVSFTRSQPGVFPAKKQMLEKALPPVSLGQAPAETKISKLRSYADSEIFREKKAYSRQQLMVQDPNAMIQTGPGLPDWEWRSYRMQWNGPVERSQTVTLLLLSPVINLVLAFVRIILLALLIFIIIDFRRWKLPIGNFTFTAVFVCMFVLPGVAVGETESRDYPSKELLTELKERLLEKPECLPNCAEIGKMVLTVNPDSLHMLLEVHAAIETAVPLPGSLALWRPDQIFLDSRPASGLLRDKGGSLWILVPEGIHAVTLVGNTAAGNTLQIPLPMRPQRVVVRSNGWDVEGVAQDGMVEGDIKLTRQQIEEKDYSVEPARTLPPFLHIERVLSLGLNWQVWTTVRRVSPSGTSVVVTVPLIDGESVTTEGVNVENGNVHINMGPKVREFRWNSTLNTESVTHLKAREAVPWTETWILDASPIWHCEFDGIPVVHHQDQAGQWRPEWRPWPGEQISIQVSRPAPIPGQSVTIDSAKLTFTPGRRFEKAELALSLRSSKGGQHRISLPEGVKLQQVKISGKTQPIREQGNSLLIPLRPGSQTIDVEWHQGAASSVLTRGPKVIVGEQAVNADVIFNMPENRWILLTRGPCLGPAVLFWSYLVVLILFGIGLGQVKWTPLKTRHWLLLGLGLTQVHPMVAIIIVGWLLALGLRNRYAFPGGWFSFNVSQIILVCWTVAALVGLYMAIHEGLLGIPNMQIAGNGSSDFWLHWTQDRIGPAMPEPWVFSMPLLMFRILMLLWSLWLAYALLQWLRWGWNCFSEGGLWRRIRSSREGDEESKLVAPESPTENE